MSRATCRKVGAWDRRAIWAILAATLALAGCDNVVTSTKPVFETVDKTDAPALKPGLWSPEQACGDNPSSICKGLNASRIVVTAADMRLWVDPARPPLSVSWPFAQPIAYAIAPGDPLVAQVQIVFSKPPRDAPKQLYFFWAMQPSARDPDGRITAAEIWPVGCGPPPKPGEPGYGAADDERLITPHPSPGLNGCTPSNRAAVARAAAHSRAWTDQAYAIRWVADAP